MQKATVTGNTAGAADTIAGPNTAEHSRPSQAGRKGRRNTGRGLMVEDKLAIIQQMIVALKQDGVFSTAGNHPTRNAAILVLDGVRYCPGCQYLRPFEQMIDDKCQYCREPK